MADLSQLSDEQLGVYRDMMTKKQSTPVSAPASQPSFLNKTISNIPGSLMNAVTHPTFPGMPMGDTTGGKPATFEDFKANTWPKIKNFAQHPIEGIKDTISSDPVGSALTAAALGRGAFPGAAAKVESAISRPVSAIGQGIKVAAPQVLGGGAMIAGGEALANVPGMEWPARIGLGYPGARQIGTGIKAGFGAARDAWKKSGVGPTTEITHSAGFDQSLPIESQARPVSESGPVAAPAMPVAKPQATPNAPVNAPGVQGPATVPMPPSAPKGQQMAAPKPLDIAENKTSLPVSGLKLKGTPDIPLVTEVAKSGTEAPDTNMSAESEQRAADLAKTRAQKGPTNYSPKPIETVPEKPKSLEVSDPTKPTVVPHYNKFSQTGGAYRVVSKGGAELGSYNTLADAQKGIDDSNFAAKQLKVKTVYPNAAKTIDVSPEPKQIQQAPHQIEAPAKTDVPDQWTWDALKDKHGQEAVDKVRAKYSDLADRLKSSNMGLDDFLQLPQEMKDSIVKVAKHPTQPNRPKYSSGYNPKYENLFKEIHGGTE